MARRASRGPIGGGSSAQAVIGKLITQVQSFEQNIKDNAEQIVEEFAHDGERDMEEIIQHAVTPTGERRAAGLDANRTGSTSPGRIDSGLMVNQVSSEFEAGGNTFTGEFGWTKEVEAYFLLQENGTKKIEAMHALQGANIKQREIAIHKLIQAGKDA